MLLISQVWIYKLDGKEYFWYHYIKVDSNGNYGTPVILYSETNLAHYINSMLKDSKKIFQVDILVIIKTEYGYIIQL